MFVLGRIFRDAWGVEAAKKQAEFNEFLEVIFMYEHQWKAGKCHLISAFVWNRFTASFFISQIISL